MMLSAQSFITDTLTAVDGVIGHYVQTVYLQLAVQYNSTLLLLCTLYILLLGDRFTMHTLSADFSTISRHLWIDYQLVFILSLCLSPFYE